MTVIVPFLAINELGESSCLIAVGELCITGLLAGSELLLVSEVLGLDNKVGLLLDGLVVLIDVDGLIRDGDEGELRGDVGLPFGLGDTGPIGLDIVAGLDIGNGLFGLLIDISISFFVEVFVPILVITGDKDFISGVVIVTRSFGVLKPAVILVLPEKLIAEFECYHALLLSCQLNSN